MTTDQTSGDSSANASATTADHAEAVEQSARHAAVAIRYDADDGAPRVVAKGYGDVAEMIIRTADAHGLFVHRSPELVALLMHVDLDRHIPPALYATVAELLAWLYRLESDAARSTPLNNPSDVGL